MNYHGMSLRGGRIWVSELDLNVRQEADLCAMHQSYSISRFLMIILVASENDGYQ